MKSKYHILMPINEDYDVEMREIEEEELLIEKEVLRKKEEQLFYLKFFKNLFLSL